MGSIVVTGSGSGLGAALKRRLEKDGQRVIGIDIRNAELEFDLGSPDGRAAAVAAAREACAGVLDGVVSCAGLGPYDDPQDIVRVNFFGAMAVIDELRPCLERGKDPAAVVISSVGGAVDALLIPEFLAACHAGDEERAVALIAGSDGNTSYVNCKRGVVQAIKRRAPE